MEIKLTEKELIKNIISALRKINKNKNNICEEADHIYNNKLVNINNTSTEYEFLIGETNMKIIIKNLILKIEFYEIRPPHSRLIFIKQIENLLNSLEILKTIHVNEIEAQSWFSILWTPVKSTKSLFMNSSFLTYYQFTINTHINEKFNDLLEIPIIGILPIKFEKKIFLSIIKKINSVNSLNIHHDINTKDDLLLLANSIVNMLVFNL